MINKEIVAQITEEVKQSLPSNPSVEQVIRETCLHSVGALSSYISEVEHPCPPNVWVLVSVDGIVPSGCLFRKDTLGVWHRWDGVEVKRYDLIHYYKYV